MFQKKMERETSWLEEEIVSCLPNSSTHLKTIVGFTIVSSTQKKEAEELGVSCFFVGRILSVGKFKL
ncbi:hypothetical protein ABKV19_002507 [Rosa sericea]